MTSPNGIICFTKPGVPAVQKAAEALRAWSVQKRMPIYFEPSYPDPDFPKKELPEALSCTHIAVSLGGDGTFLRMAGALHGHPHILIGAHLGGLGFLTEFTPEELISVLNAYPDGDSVVTNRPYLAVTLNTAKGKTEHFSAINDVVITKAALSRIIGVDVSINGERMGILRGDGVIVSTPLGSTAYSLAAGGPIVHPMLSALLITPICPHTLSHRPLVIPMGSQVMLQVMDGRRFVGDNIAIFLSVDGQRGHAIGTEDRITVTKSPHALHILTNPKRTYFGILQSKFAMGERSTP